MLGVCEVMLHVQTGGLLPLMAVLALIPPGIAAADMGPPVHLQISETEEGLYIVRWRVPKALPPRAVPKPIRRVSAGDGSECHRPAAAWRSRATGAARRALRVGLWGWTTPIPDLSLTTVVRVDLLLGPLRPRPQSGRGVVATSRGEVGLRRPPEEPPTPCCGASHRTACSSPSASWAGLRRTIRLVTALALGQQPRPGRYRRAGAAQIVFVIGVVILARQVLEPDEDRGEAPAAVAGFGHGLGLAAMLGNDLGEGELDSPPSSSRCWGWTRRIW